MVFENICKQTFSHKDLILIEVLMFTKYKIPNTNEINIRKAFLMLISLTS